MYDLISNKFQFIEFFFVFFLKKQQKQQQQQNNENSEEKKLPCWVFFYLFLYYVFNKL